MKETIKKFIVGIYLRIMFGKASDLQNSRTWLIVFNVRKYFENWKPNQEKSYTRKLSINETFQILFLSTLFAWQLTVALPYYLFLVSFISETGALWGSSVLKQNLNDWFFSLQDFNCFFFRFMYGALSVFSSCATQHLNPN